MVYYPKIGEYGMKRQSVFLVCIILIILTLSIGYAIFRSSVDVVGKSAIVKDLDVVFYEVGEITEEGSVGATAKIMSDKKRIVINAPKLTFKGAYAMFPITIKNTGSIPAKLESIYEYGTNKEGPIKVSYDGIGVTNEVLNPGDTTSFNVKVSWEGDTSKDYELLEFMLKFNYVQV